ncbi:MAG: long-chain fatty acid--CoA ligase, partial [Calditrichaeota bacterium]|nr:long-chain fatty acid--CoA ligase [Calditrichota bacterium]
LFGLIETSSLFIAGRPTTDFCWIQGDLLPNTDFKIVTEDLSADYGEIWLKGNMIMQGYDHSEDKTFMISEDRFFQTGLIGRREEDGSLQIWGNKANQINPETGNPIFPELIEASLNELPTVKESLVYPENGQLIACVYLDANTISAEELDRPQKIKERILKQINDELPEDVRISDILIQESPFEKNVFKQIIRRKQTPCI